MLLSTGPSVMATQAGACNLATTVLGCRGGLQTSKFVAASMPGQRPQGLATKREEPAARLEKSDNTMHKSGALLSPVEGEDNSKVVFLLQPLDDDEEAASTEAPSSGLCSEQCSDTESASGAEGGSGSCADDEIQPTTPVRGPLLASHKSLQQQLGRAVRLSAAARSKHRSRGVAFCRTSLDPIPGTPHGMSEHPPLSFAVPTSSDDDEAETSVSSATASPLVKLHPQAWSMDACRVGSEEAFLLAAASANDEAMPLAGLLLPLATAALLSTVPPPGQRLADATSGLPPAAPKRRILDAITSLEDRTPIKVSMLQGHPAYKKLSLDPLKPAKKRPILAEKQRKLETREPVKKRVTPWLMAEPITVFPAAPR